MSLHRILLVAALFLIGSNAHATVLIGDGINNGNFADSRKLVNVTSMSGWSANNDFWIGSGTSNLTSAPFGADSVAKNRYIQVHNNGGTNLRSTSFYLGATDALALSFDVQVRGSASNSKNLRAALYDVNGNFVDNIGIVTAAGNFGSQWIQYDFNIAPIVPNAGMYELRFIVGATSVDYWLDRVHLESTDVPAPASLLLLMTGLLFSSLRQSAVETELGT